MDFRVLGPLEGYVDGRSVAIGGGRQRALLALLLVHAGEVVSRDRLIDELWRGAPPPGAAQSLDAYLSRLRRALREALGTWRGAAYAEVADETWARPEAERLEELRLCAIEERVEAELALGRH